MEKDIKKHKILIISHISDPDGAGAVVLGFLAFKKIDYLLIEIGEQAAMLDFIKKNTYEQIYICDIAMNNAIGDEIAKLPIKILHFDHHGTNKYVDKYDFATVKEVVNNHRTCGTELFYLYLIANGFLKDSPVIRTFVELVRSYDVWDWIADNNYLASDLSTLFSVLGPITFINDMVKLLQSKTEFVLNSGQRLLIDYKYKDVDEYAKICNQALITAPIAGLKAGIVICDKYSSQVGHYLCANNDIDCAIMLNFLEDKASLRSIGENNVSVVAQKFGGGGHKNASGLPLTKENKIFFLKIIMENLTK